LVGSSARDERRDDSDIDVLIDVVDEMRFSLMDRIGVMHLLGDALSLTVDVSRRDTLDPRVRERMVKDAIKIF
jgi:predicted nucleotidyltransferase